MTDDSERVAWWEPSSTASKVFAVLLVLNAAQLLWSATKGRFDWGQYVLTAVLAGAYAVAQGVAQKRLTFARQIRVSLVATLAAVVGGVGFCVYMVFRAAQEPDVADRSVVGFAVLFGGFALLGVGLAVPYALQLLRLLRSTESDES